jgi:hypothetical protein
MKSLNVSVAGALLALIASQAPIAAPSANTVYFMNPSYGGSGCPQGSVSYTIEEQQGKHNNLLVQSS